MAYNPKSLQNLKHFKKGNCANPAGRPPLLSTVINGIPDDAKKRIYAVLHLALKQPNRKALQAFLSEKEEELGEYGFVLQRCAVDLIGKYGWQAMMDILDRLFGKPRQEAQVDLSIGLTEPPVIVFSKKGTEEEGTEEE